LLWAFEGVTSYYDDLALLRCGLIDQERYLGLLAQTVSMVERGPGRKKQTLEESSFDAWIKYYRQDENSPNSIVSYYTKGALVALALDLLIRQKSHGAQSLDDVMRALWHKWLQDGKGLDEDEWERHASAVSGVDLSEFFDLALRSTTPLPLVELLSSQGIKLEWTRATHADDRGGLAGSTSGDALRLVLGVKTSSDASGIKLQHVYDDGAAQRAGLSAGDVLVALNGVRVVDLDKMLTRLSPGDPVQVHAFRRDELRVFQVIPAKPAVDICRLSLSQQAGEWPRI
jgi:predicted metalloprotease with PDZ domain